MAGATLLELNGFAPFRRGVLEPMRLRFGGERTGAASSSASVIATLALLQSIVMVVLFLARHFGWRRVLGVPGASWLLPLVSPAEESVEADCSGKSEVQ